MLQSKRRLEPSRSRDTPIHVVSEVEVPRVHGALLEDMCH